MSNLTSVNKKISRKKPYLFFDIRNRLSIVVTLPLNPPNTQIDDSFINVHLLHESPLTSQSMTRRDPSAPWVNYRCTENVITVVDKSIIPKSHTTLDEALFGPALAHPRRPPSAPSTQNTENRPHFTTAPKLTDD